MRVDFSALIDYMNEEYNFNKHNNLRILRIEDGFAEAEVELTQAGKNPQGVAHGSLLFTLADCVTGLASVTTGKGMLTLDANFHFLRAVSSGNIRAVGRRIKEGKTTGVFDAEVYDDQDRLAAKGSFTVFYTGELKIPADWIPRLKNGDSE